MMAWVILTMSLSAATLYGAFFLRSMKLHAAGHVTGMNSGMMRAVVMFGLYLLILAYCTAYSGIPWEMAWNIFAFSFLFMAIGLEGTIWRKASLPLLVAAPFSLLIAASNHGHALSHMVKPALVMGMIWLVLMIAGLRNATCRRLALRLLVAGLMVVVTPPLLGVAQFIYCLLGGSCWM